MDRETVMKKLNLAPLDALLQLLAEEYCCMSLSMEELKYQYFEPLSFLRAFFTHPNEQWVDNDTLELFMKLGSKVACIISAFDLNNMDEEKAQKLLKQLMFPLRHVEMYKVPAFDVNCQLDNERKPSRKYYPTTDQHGFVDQLVENLKQLVMTNRADSLGSYKRYVVRLQQILHLAKSSLVQIPEPRKGEPYMKELVTSIAGIAYEAEYIIDSYLVRKIPIWCCIRWLGGVLSEAVYKMSLVKMELGEVDVMMSIVSVILNSDPNKLNIIPIVMNTQLGVNRIREIFNVLANFKRFPRRTWSLVSSYKERKKEVIVDLVLNYQGLARARTRKHLMAMEFKEMERLLQRLLRPGNRCLIILEDVHDIDAIDDIKKVLPNLPYGSTILVTTCSPELADLLRIDSQQAFADNASTSQIHKPITNDHVVGFRAEIERMLELLTRGGKSNLRVISIVGMAGQGKTTLAKKLYSHESVTGYFDARTWCCVSQSYKKRELLLELLGHVVQLSDTIHYKNDEELAEMLYKYLKGQRFLIFLDDIWEIGAWNDLARCFPDDNNGS